MDIFVMNLFKSVVLGVAGYKTPHCVEPSKALLCKFCFKLTDIYYWNFKNNYILTHLGCCRKTKQKI